MIHSERMRKRSESINQRNGLTKTCISLLYKPMGKVWHSNKNKGMPIKKWKTIESENVPKCPQLSQRLQINVLQQPKRSKDPQITKELSNFDALKRQAELLEKQMLRDRYDSSDYTLPIQGLQKIDNQYFDCKDEAKIDKLWGCTRTSTLSHREGRRNQFMSTRKYSILDKNRLEIKRIARTKIEPYSSSKGESKQLQRCTLNAYDFAVSQTSGKIETEPSYAPQKFDEILKFLKNQTKTPKISATNISNRLYTRSKDCRKIKLKKQDRKYQDISLQANPILRKLESPLKNSEIVIVCV